MAKKEKKAEGGNAEKSVQREDAAYIPRLNRLYRETVRGKLREKFSYTNEMTVPRLQKIVVNIGLGEAVANPKVIDSALNDLRLITGQQPVVRRARKSIAGFKLREGLAIGVKVTLRNCRMWEFADRLINVALPRVRDFKGINPKGFDGRGNFTMGVKEQIIFPEIDYDKVDAIRGLNISFVTSATSNDEGRELLANLGMPFRRRSAERN